MLKNTDFLMIECNVMEYGEKKIEMMKERGVG